jgi:hypothetical protein
MARRLNPRIFLVLGIGTFIVTGIALVAGLVFLSKGQTDSGWDTSMFLAVMFFPEMGALGVLLLWQWQKAKAINRKLAALEEDFASREKMRLT